MPAAPESRRFVVQRRMARTLLLLAAAVGAVDAAGAQAGRVEVPRYSIEDFLKTTSFSDAGFSPDGRKILVSSNASGVYNAIAVPVAGGAPVPLTASTSNAVYGVSYFPRDERVLYTSDSGGNELSHLYVRDPDGRVRDLTPGAKLQANFVDWARDERSFFLTTNERDARFFDLYEIAADGYARTLLYRNDGGYEIGAVSPDRRYVALLKTHHSLDTDVHLHDRRTGTMRHLTPHSGSVQTYPVTFSRDGGALYVLTDEGSEFTYLARYDLSTGKRTTLLKPDWDVAWARLSRTGRYLAVGINADARTEVRVFETATMRPVPLPPLPQGAITSIAFSRDERQVAFYASDSRHPRDLFVMTLPGGAPRRLTRALNPKIDPAHLVDAQVVRFPSYDGLQIPGLLYRPHGASAANKVPAIVMVHGGPGGQARVGYSALKQYLVNHGYAVFDINNRGSSGYGKTFYAMDDRKHGEADLGDVVASKRMLIETGFVDPDRIGVMGGSYGGYMVLAALAFRPDTFRVGVNIFGVANWLRTLQSIPPYWESFRQSLYAELGDPSADSVRLHAISPLFHAHRIRQPLIVLQGANDPRVLQVESDEIVASVRKNGVPVEYIVFPDEGHGFRKRENEIRGYKAILDFLDANLKGSRAPSP